MQNGVPAGVAALDSGKVNGDWKATIIHDPERVMASFATEYLNANIRSDGSGVTVTLDWYVMYFEFDAQPFELDFMDDSVFTGRWEGDGFWASGEGTIHLNHFYEQNGKQYAIGAVDMPDGTPAYIALVRP